MMPIGRLFLVSLIFVANLAFARGVSAQDWPARPVTMVVPFSAGSGIDAVGRIFAARLSELLSQRVIVENVTGAGGMIGTSRVARATPDGYQFEIGSTGDHVLSQSLYKVPLYNAASDFAPVGLIAETPMVLVVQNKLPVTNLQDFIAYARANQAKMRFGSAGTGSIAHLACAMLNAAIGINVTPVPYRGGEQAMLDVIAGRIDYSCLPISTTISQIEGNQMKAIAILTKNRSPRLPSLASAHEQGLADFNASLWYAFFLPKGTSEAIVQKLHDATVATMNTSTVQERLQHIGVDLVAPDRRSSSYLATFVVREIEKWGNLIKAANIKAQ